MSADYDVAQAYKRIEDELISSMIRNFERHKAEETLEGFNWEQWQTIQLREMERYRLANQSKFNGEFEDIHKRVGDAINGTYKGAQAEQERKILRQVKKGNIPAQDGKGIERGFFGINAGRVSHLIDATRADFSRGQYALLRVANDEYRKTIFNAQMYASTAGTYEKAVDMATKDFLQKGIQCVVYKNGSRHSLEEYSRMALKTGQKRAYLMGEGDALDKYGIHTVRVNNRTDACPLCVKWLGKVLVDDVYAGGTLEESQAKGIPLLSQAIDEGFLHPNCKDVYTMYIEGVSEPANPWSKEEIKEITDKYNDEERLRHAEGMRDTYDRMARYSLDPENQQRYQMRAERWGERAGYWQGRIDGTIPPSPVPPITVEKPVAPVSLTEEETARQRIIDTRKELEPKQKELASKEAELKTIKDAEKKWKSVHDAWGDDTKDTITHMAQNRRMFQGMYDDENVVFFLEKHFDVFQRGEVDEILKKPLQKEIRPLKKEVKNLVEQLNVRYDELEQAIGAPNISQLSFYGEKHTTQIKHFLDDAPANARNAWNKVADDFHVLNPTDTWGKKRTGAYYNAFEEGHGGVHLSINSVAKGDSIHAPYETVFHEFAHNMDYELNRRIGDGKRGKAFTQWYKDGAFGKKVMEEVEKAIDDYGRANGYFGLPNKGTVVVEVDKAIRQGLLRPEERGEMIRRKMQTERVDKIGAQKAFNKHMKETYPKIDRANLSDMFEHAMIDDKDLYPFGAGHGKMKDGRRYFSKDGEVHVAVGKEAFAEMYDSTIANGGSLELIKEFLPESYKLFEEIIEVANGQI